MDRVEAAQPELARHPTNEVEPRDKVVGGSVSETEKTQVNDALKQAGFKNESQGVRAVMLTFVTSAEVRDAVARALRVA